MASLLPAPAAKRLFRSKSALCLVAESPWGGALPPTHGPTSCGVYRTHTVAIGGACQLFMQSPSRFGADRRLCTLAVQTSGRQKALPCADRALICGWTLPPVSCRVSSCCVRVEACTCTSRAKAFNRSPFLRLVFPGLPPTYPISRSIAVRFWTSVVSAATPCPPFPGKEQGLKPHHSERPAPCRCHFFELHDVPGRQGALQVFAGVSASPAQQRSARLVVV